jgi:hypothetical protein
MAYTPVDQNLSNLYSVTAEGQTSAQVKQLQQALIAAGYKIPAGATGFYGPQTKAALEQWKTKLSGGGTGGTKSDPKQPLTDEEYDAGAAGHPKVVESIAAGNTLADIEAAASSGDFSGLKNQYGQPFSVQEQTDALAAGMEDNKLFYEAQQAKEKADAESNLARKNADYQDYLISSGEKFAQDKSTLDQNASDTGMLFSTSRNQKEQKLQKSYEQEQSSKLASYGRDIGDTARNYQYAYGNDAAGGLSQYYNAPSNTYNPNVATGGVGTGGLSSIYNPSQYNFQGTQNVARKGAANTRAAGYLANKGNKLLSTSYNNQF